MTLMDIKQYLEQVKIANISMLCRHFDTDPIHIQQLLQPWIRKGCVKECQKTSKCGTKCNMCSPLVTQQFEWVGS